LTEYWVCSDSCASSTTPPMVTNSTYAVSASPSETSHSSRARLPVATLGVASSVRLNRSSAGFTAEPTSP
jgi:hypothetical protein